MSPDEEIADIKRETFDRLKVSRRVWIIEENGADFMVHQWSGLNSEYGPGVAPQSNYPTLRRAASRLLQIMHTGPIAPQTWPEEVCIGAVSLQPKSPNHLQDQNNQVKP